MDGALFMEVSKKRRISEIALGFFLLSHPLLCSCIRGGGRYLLSWPFGFACLEYDPASCCAHLAISSRIAILTIIVIVAWTR